MSAATALRFEATGKIFDTGKGSSIEALRDVNFAVKEHEFVAVLGPSGCGKSTLLRLLAGLTPATNGRVEIDGAPVAEPSDRIGIVFQSPTLLSWATVKDNVVFPAKHKFGRARKEHRETALALLAKVGLKGFEDRLPYELSGGMQQRVGIARALLLDPDVLLMDEPFSALDALTREEMGFELLRIWSERRKTVLFITHSINESVLLADRVLVMSESPGCIIEDLVVPLPRPRDIKTLSMSKMHECTDHLRSLLLKRPS